MPSVSATEQLRRLAGLPRYTGMDAYAQELADSGALDQGPYAKAVSATADTAAEAWELMRPSVSNGYTRCGIGLHNNYWIMVLS